MNEGTNNGTNNGHDGEDHIGKPGVRPNPRMIEAYFCGVITGICARHGNAEIDSHLRSSITAALGTAVWNPELKIANIHAGFMDGAPTEWKYIQYLDQLLKSYIEMATEIGIGE